MNDAMLDAVRRMDHFEKKYAPHPSGLPLCGWLDEFYRDQAVYRQAVQDFYSESRRYAEQRRAFT